MKKDFIIDYLSCILIKLLGPLIRSLPKSFALFLGKRLGELFYYFDFKHKAIAYSNIKTAFGDKFTPYQLSKTTKEFYQTFGQNLIEILLIPLINKEYINKYITFEGLNHITGSFKRGKGVILLGVHAGSWELTNIICANLGFPFFIFVRDQRHPRLNSLLNLYRSQKGCKIIQRKNETRALLMALKNKQAVGMTVDQGGKSGILVKFFGKDASMATGAVRLALKYDVTVIPCVYIRTSGPYMKIIIDSAFEIERTDDKEKDIRHNLQRLISIFEKYIELYPQEYLWSYKIWKYTDEKNILILNDGKTGHLRQSQAVADMVCDYLKEKAIRTKVDNLEIKFKNNFAKASLLFSSCLAGKYHCQGCLWCLKAFLKNDTYKPLISIKPDMVISCGSSVAPINFVVSRENLAKSIVIMQPSILSTRRFDLVIMPGHDNPPKRKNVVVTEGALNLIDEEYLKKQSQKLIQVSGIPSTSLGAGRFQVSGIYIGLLIGGDTKRFHLDASKMLEVIGQIKSVVEEINADILVTTSRRTSREIEELVKEEFNGYSPCKLLIIANEKNLPFAVGGILGLSQIIITTPESISMVSEAVSSKKYVFVFNLPGLNKKHRRFLDYFVKNKYIYLVEPAKLSKNIEDIWMKKPLIYAVKNNALVREAISRIVL